MAHLPGDGAGAECTVDNAIQFCERCGRDRDAFAASRAAFRDCPACGSACCPDCWNLVDGACLACAPFRLRAETSRSRVVPVAGIGAPASAQGDPPDPASTARVPGAMSPGPGDTPAAPGAAPAAPGAAPVASDPYADLRDVPGTTLDVDPFGRPVGHGIVGTWETSRPTARQRPRETAAAGAAPGGAAPDAWRAVVAAADPSPPPPRRRRRSGRVAVAAVAGWVFVGALAVAALGANPGSPTASKPTLAPVTPVPTAVPTPTPTPVATAKPTAKPKPDKAPKATAKPVRRDVAVPPAATAKPVRSTPRPAKPPAVVTPPPIVPPPTMPPESATP